MAAVLFAGNAVSAAAITGTGQVDFTDHSVWGGANGNSSFSATLFDNFRVTLTATGGSLRTNAGDQTGWVGGNCSHPTSSELACDGDGIGIHDDEITGNASEVLTVSFTDAITHAAFGVTLTRIEILDLFALAAPDVGGEIAKYSINGGSFVDILPQPDMANPGTGYKSEAITPISGVTSIAFIGRDDPRSDFALAQLTFAPGPPQLECPPGGCPIPEPANFPIFVLALAGLAYIKRRKLI